MFKSAGGIYSKVMKWASILPVEDGFIIQRKNPASFSETKKFREVKPYVMSSKRLSGKPQTFFVCLAYIALIYN